MSLLDRLNSRFGRYAVPNVTLILIAGQVIVYLAASFGRRGGGNFPVLDQLILIPELVLEGQVWRLVTFVFEPPYSNPLIALIFWSAFYLCGNVLEQVWGTFRYNVYLFIGYSVTVAVSFLAPQLPASNFFLKTTVFLAFAQLNPDFVFHLYFLIPIRAKWLALFAWVYIGYWFWSGSWMDRVYAMASVVNFLLFFSRDIWRAMKHGHRRMRQHAKTLRAPLHIVHKCHVCGVNSEEHPRMQFRYCSKCVGQYAYCPEHLHDHEHVEAELPAESRS